MAFNNIVKSLCEDYNVNVSKGKDLYAFLINNEYKVYIEYSDKDKAFVVYAAVCDIPNETQVDIYEDILKANYFGTDTGKSTLSIDKNTDKIVLFRWFNDVETRYSDFVPCFSSFIGHLSHWKEKIENYPKYKEVAVKPPQRDNIIKP